MYTSYQRYPPTGNANVNANVNANANVPSQNGTTNSQQQQQQYQNRSSTGYGKATNAGGGVNNGPPPVGSYYSGASPSTTRTTSTGGGGEAMKSPMQPIPPPMKKQRATTSTTTSSSTTTTTTSVPPRAAAALDNLSHAADDAIARRRAELRRMQQSRATATGYGAGMPMTSYANNTPMGISSTTQTLLAKARASIQAAGGASTSNASVSSADRSVVSGLSHYSSAAAAAAASRSRPPVSTNGTYAGRVDGGGVSGNGTSASFVPSNRMTGATGVPTRITLPTSSASAANVSTTTANANVNTNAAPIPDTQANPSTTMTTTKTATPTRKTTMAELRAKAEAAAAAATKSVTKAVAIPPPSLARSNDAVNDNDTAADVARRLDFHPTTSTTTATATTTLDTKKSVAFSSPPPPPTHTNHSPSATTTTYAKTPVPTQFRNTNGNARHESENANDDILTNGTTTHKMSKLQKLEALRSAAITPQKMHGDVDGDVNVNVDGDTEDVPALDHAPIQTPNGSFALYDDDDDDDDKDTNDNQETETKHMAKPKSTTNNTESKQTSTLRLVKELNQVTQEKAGALQKVATLEEELKILRLKHEDYGNTNNTNGNDNHSTDMNAIIQTLVEIASNQGKDAAVQYAQSQILLSNIHSTNSSTDQTIGFATDESTPMTTATTTSRGRIGRGRRNEPYNGAAADDNDDDPSSSKATSTRRRMRSPQPNRRRTKKSILQMEGVAARAVETVADEYSSDLASYTIRKPYGGCQSMECQVGGGEDNNGNGSSNEVVGWIQPVNVYAQKATVEDETSLEVVAHIGADGSVLLLHGTSNVHHGTRLIGDVGSVTGSVTGEFVGYDWKDYGNVDEGDGVLGCIVYIDVDGNEREYWLDAIYEEALSIRETYCSNLFSAASALVDSAAAGNESSTSPSKVRGRGSGFKGEGEGQGIMASPPVFQQSPLTGTNGNTSLPKPVSVDACVGTDDIPFIPPQPTTQVQQKSPPSGKTESTTTTNTKQQSRKSKSKPKSSKEEVTKTLPPDADDFDSGSTDAFSALLGFIISNIFALVWFIVYRVPMKILSMTIKFLLWMTIISIVWLYFADDNGAMDMGAGISYRFNPPGIY